MAASVEPSAPTQFLQVTGMVTPDVLVDDEEYAEVTQPSWQILSDMSVTQSVQAASSLITELHIHHHKDLNIHKL